METIKQRYWNWAILSLSVAVPAVVALLLFMPVSGIAGNWVKMLPHLNGALNTVTALVLVVGYLFIRNNNQAAHKRAMLTAFVLGTIFLVSYLIYHSSVPSTAYGNTGWIRSVYFVLLITHILLAMAVVPLVLLALIYALQKNFVKHRKIVKFAFPVWLYVSVTGVVVYLMISPFYT
jgi:putative membrane protein